MLWTSLLLRDVAIDGGWKLFYSGVDPTMSAQAGVGIHEPLVVRLRVRMNSFCSHHVSASWSSEYRTDQYAYFKYVPSMRRIKAGICRWSEWCSSSRITNRIYNPNREFQRTHWNRRPGRAWLVGIEMLCLTRMIGIYCNSVAATDLASRIPFFNTEMFTSILGTDLVQSKNLWLIFTSGRLNCFWMCWTFK